MQKHKFSFVANARNKIALPASQTHVSSQPKNYKADFWKRKCIQSSHETFGKSRSCDKKRKNDTKEEVTARVTF
jgi:hypothetical protein